MKTSLIKKNCAFPAGFWWHTLFSCCLFSFCVHHGTQITDTSWWSQMWHNLSRSRYTPYDVMHFVGFVCVNTGRDSYSRVCSELLVPVCGGCMLLGAEPCGDIVCIVSLIHRRLCFGSKCQTVWAASAPPLYWFIRSTSSTMLKTLGDYYIIQG